MSTLESIVLPLEQSRSLVEHGIVLDTAISWEKGGPIFTGWAHSDIYVAPAPALSELLDAIRAKADAMEIKVDRGMKLERNDFDGKIEWELVGQGRGSCEDDWQEAEGNGDTDLLAAAALLMEVSK